MKSVDVIEEVRKEAPKASSAYFMALTVENIRCFGPRQTLDLSDSKGRPAQWTVILGDNGTGKTTLLQCLAWLEPAPEIPRTIPLESMMPKLSVRPVGKDWLACSHRKDGQIMISATIQSGTALIEKGRGKIGFDFLIRGLPKGYTATAAKAHITEGLVCYAYGASRRMGKTLLSDESDEKDDHQASLFRDDVALLNAEEWLLQLDYSASKDSELKDKFRKRLEQVKEILISILPDVTEIEITEPTGEQPNPKVRFKTGYGRVSIHDLSLGYRTMIAWMADLARRLFERYPDSPDPIAEPAVVLIDEIDLHLHPKWQRDLMRFLSKRFVNTQFIVTAHSPLVVQSAPTLVQSGRSVNIVVLKQDGDHVVIQKEEKSVRGWRVDQVLASELFGISTYPDELETLLGERRTILSKAKLTKDDKKRLRDLEARIGYMPTAEDPKNIRAMEIIRKAAEDLKKGKSVAS